MLARYAYKTIQTGLIHDQERERKKPRNAGLGRPSVEDSGHEDGDECQQKDQDATSHGKNNGHQRHDGFDLVFRLVR